MVWRVLWVLEWHPSNPIPLWRVHVCGEQEREKSSLMCFGFSLALQGPCMIGVVYEDFEIGIGAVLEGLVGFQGAKE